MRVAREGDCGLAGVSLRVRAPAARETDARARARERAETLSTREPRASGWRVRRLGVWLIHN